jgi:NADPH:quinone reductase-like Zn-dependent oxidoreductase
VVVTSRDADKREAALAKGAVAALDSAAERWDVQADVVAESVGAATWDASIAAVRPAGRLVVCGATSGGRVQLDLPRLWFKQIEVIGSTMASYEEFAEVTRLVAQGLPVAVDSEHPLDAYPTALARLRAGTIDGKLVLTR